MFITMSYVLSLFLTIAIIVLLVRKLLIGDVDNFNGSIILIVLALSLIGLICSMILAAGAVRLDLINMPSEEFAQTKNQNIISLAIGYISLSLDYIIFKIIEKKNKNVQPKQESHWDLEKFK